MIECKLIQPIIIQPIPARIHSNARATLRVDLSKMRQLPSDDIRTRMRQVSTCAHFRLRRFAIPMRLMRRWL